MKFMEKIYKTVLEIVSKHFGIDSKMISKETHFEKDLGADSVDMIMLVIEMENVYGFSIPEDLLDKITTPESAARIIKKRL